MTSIPKLHLFGPRHNRGIWYWSVRLALRDWFRRRFLEYSYYDCKWRVRNWRYW